MRLSGDFLKKNWKEIVFLFLLVSCCLLLFNKLNLSANRWTVHPDDQNIMVFSRVLLETGHLWYQSPYNQEYETDAFYPGVNDYESDSAAGHKIHASYAPGVYIITCLGNIFGYKGPFFIVGILGVAGVLFFYFFIRQLFGVFAAMMASVFLAFSPPYVYWSNSLFTNIPAMFFLMGGLYFLGMLSKSFDKRRYYFLAVIFFLAAIWVRGDYIFLVCITIVVFLFGFRKEINWKYTLQCAGLVCLLTGAIMAVNVFTTGSALGVVPNEGGLSKATEVLVKYPLRSYSPGVLFNNFSHYVYSVVPLILLTGLLGIALWIFSGNRKNPFLAALFLILLFTLFYYGKNSNYWGYDNHWLASSYSRYFLPLYMALAVFAAVFILNWLKSIPMKNLAVAACALVITAQLVLSIGILSEWDFGLKYTDSWNMSSKQVNDFTSSLPEDAVVVNFTKDFFYRKMIVERTVFNPFLIEGEGKLERSVEILDDLAANDIPVYIINNVDLEIKEIDEWDKANESFHLEKMKHRIDFKTDTRDPDIYLFVPDGA